VIGNERIGGVSTHKTERETTETTIARMENEVQIDEREKEQKEEEK